MTLPLNQKSFTSALKCLHQSTKPIANSRTCWLQSSQADVVASRDTQSRIHRSSFVKRFILMLFVNFWRASFKRGFLYRCIMILGGFMRLGIWIWWVILWEFMGFADGLFSMSLIAAGSHDDVHMIWWMMVYVGLMDGVESGFREARKLTGKGEIGYQSRGKDILLWEEP